MQMVETELEISFEKCRAGGTAPVGQAKTGPLFSTTLVMIVLFILPLMW